MIKSFKHKGLEKFFKKSSQSGIQANHAKKLRMQLAALDTSGTTADMDLPGYRLHPLKGDRAAYWAIDVGGNCRLTFRFEADDAFNVSHRKVAKLLDVSPSTFNRLVKGQSGVTPEMALRLSKTLGRSPESWLQMQYNHDLRRARGEVRLGKVKKLKISNAATIDRS